ncbi:hypothetical protein ACQP1O_10920 [Nocardia sp. CA-151230]|uniref:hypothetical protein n=1 Tax=Nocardia sp. CA-151230 TaxID=3239982 RepID=UPI003D8E69F1
MTINTGSTDWVPDSCTLPTAARPMRVTEFDQFFADAVQHTERPDRTRLDLFIDADAEPLGRDLADRETGCCSFFTFTFEPADAGVVMHIDVPAAHVGVLDALETRAGAVSR